MSRPARFDEASILDAALSELVERGPRGVSVAGIARTLGAPSGSLYHRFSSRDHLLAAVWLRTAERFQEGFVARLDEAEGGLAGVEAAVRFVVAWARRHPAEVGLLTRFRREDLVAGAWPPEVAERAAHLSRQLDDAAKRLAERLWPDREPDMPALWLAAVSIPEAAVRRYLRAGQIIPAGLEEAVARASRAVLEP